MSQYKLHYFDLRARGEAIRLMLHYVGQPFEDFRFTFAQWPKQRELYFYGKVPVLEVDGKQLAQSGAILRFLGEVHGLNGTSEWERAKMNEIFDFFKETDSELSSYLFFGHRSANAEQKRKDVFLPGAQRHFPLYAKLLAQSGSGFFAPSGPTFVDFVLAEYFDLVYQVEPNVIGQYPQLIAHTQKVYSLPQLKQYMSERK